MNLQDFDRYLPDGWQTVVLHEFGHANRVSARTPEPAAGCDFRMEDDAGYVPTRDSKGRFKRTRRAGAGRLYRSRRPPNGWPKRTVDFNILALKGDSRKFLTTDFDSDSVMKYDLPAWMFKGGTNSHCAIPRRISLDNSSFRDIFL